MINSKTTTLKQAREIVKHIFRKQYTDITVSPSAMAITVTLKRKYHFSLRYHMPELNAAFGVLNARFHVAICNGIPHAQAVFYVTVLPGRDRSNASR